MCSGDSLVTRRVLFSLSSFPTISPFLILNLDTVLPSTLGHASSSSRNNSGECIVSFISPSENGVHICFDMQIRAIWSKSRSLSSTNVSIHHTQTTSHSFCGLIPYHTNGLKFWRKSRVSSSTLALPRPVTMTIHFFIDLFWRIIFGMSYHNTSASDAGLMKEIISIGDSWVGISSSRRPKEARLITSGVWVDQQSGMCSTLKCFSNLLIY